GGSVEHGGIVENHEGVARQPRGQEHGGITVDGQGQDGDLIQRLDRTLGRRIEEPERLHVVADELRPHRPLPGRPQEVPHAPAPAARRGGRRRRERGGGGGVSGWGGPPPAGGRGGGRRGGGASGGGGGAGGVAPTTAPPPPGWGQPRAPSAACSLGRPRHDAG